MKKNEKDKNEKKKIIRDSNPLLLATSTRSKKKTQNVFLIQVGMLVQPEPTTPLWQEIYRGLCECLSSTHSAEHFTICHALGPQVGPK